MTYIKKYNQTYFLIQLQPSLVAGVVPVFIIVIFKKNLQVVSESQYLMTDIG